MTFKPKHRVYFAWGVLILSVIMWPATALTIAKKEPQVVLGITFLGLIVGSLEMLMTAQVGEESDS